MSFVPSPAFNDDGSPTERTIFVGMTAIKIIMTLMSNQKQNPLSPIPQELISHMAVLLIMFSGTGRNDQETVADVIRRLKEPDWTAHVKKIEAQMEDYFNENADRWVMGDGEGNPGVDKFLR